MRKILVVSFVFVVSCSFGQTNNSQFFTNLEFGTSLTYMWDDNNRPNGDYIHQELTWNMNFKARVYSGFWLGVQVNPIFSRTREFATVTRQNFNFYGVMAQYEILSAFDFAEESDISPYIELSINRSNMLVTRFAKPSSMEGINYLGFGGGFQALINKKGGKNLYAEVAFFNYHIINNIVGKSNYTQYIIGLNYRLGKK